MVPGEGASIRSSANMPIRAEERGRDPPDGPPPPGAPEPGGTERAFATPAARLPALEPIAGLPGPVVPLKSRRKRLVQELRQAGSRLGARVRLWRLALAEALSELFFSDALILAGNIAFVSLFAVFPFLILLLAVAGLVGETEVARRLVELALALIPPEVAAVLAPAIEEVLAGPGAGVLTFTILVSLWFASSGLESLRHAMNHAYKVPDPPHFLIGRLYSLWLTVLSAFAIVVAATALIAWPVAREVVAWLSQREALAGSIDELLRYGLGAGILFALTVLLNLVLPDLELRLRDVLPGSLVAVVAWILVAEAFSWYLRNFARYSLVYGSLGGIVLTLLFFYISAAIFIFGAELNSALLRLRLERDRESGEAQASESA